MNEEIMGVTEDAIVEETSEQVATEQGNDVLTLDDLLDPIPDETGEEQQQEDAPAVETTKGEADPPKVEPSRQERKDIAFGKRLAAERKKFERDPVYALGREYAAQYGGDASKALEAMRSRQAEELAKDPAALAKYVIEQRNTVHEPDIEIEAENETDEQKAQRIVSDIRNVLGDNADLKAYMAIDPDFMANCDQYGAAAAVAAMAKKATAQNKTAAKIEQNRRLPQPIRPSGNAQPKAVDFTTMSQKEWEAFEAKAKKARMDGKKIMF